MEPKRRRLDFLLELDFFGKEPNLYFEKKKKKTSYTGLIFTLIYIIIYVAFFIYKIVRMAKRIDVTFYDTYAYKDFPSIKLTNEEFYGGFSMGGIIDETLYYATADFYSGVKKEGVWHYNITSLEVETCNLERFGSKYKDLFRDQPLNNLYCMKNVDFSLEGYANLDRYSYINVKVYPCVGKTRDGTKDCAPTNNIIKFFAANTIEFKMEDNLLSPEIYETPVEPQRKDINAPVFLTVYQKIYSYIQIVFIETDNDITGLNFLAENKVEQYPKYDNSMLIAAPGDANIIFTPGKPVCDITMQLDQKILTTKRKYTTLLEVLGDVGGLMELVYSFFNMICSFIMEISYEKNLVNNLFAFDLKRKVIKFNHNKKSGDTIHSKQTLKNMDDLRDRNSISELKKDSIDIYSKEEIHKINQKNRKSKTRTNKRQKSNYSSKPFKVNNNFDMSNDEKLNSNDKNIMDQNSNDLQNLERNSKNYVDSNGRATEGKVEMNNRNNLFEKISVNSIWLYCLSSKTNMEKVIFDEGTKLISKNLDIMNIFDKLYLIERIQKNVNVDLEYMDMTERFKRKVDSVLKMMAKEAENITELSQ